jgi:methionyl-tRNA formyltransferase
LNLGIIEMRIVYFGTSSFAIPPLQALSKAGYDIVVVTQPDRPAGRGNKLTAPPVKIAAEELLLPVIQPENCRDTDFISQIENLQPDFLVVAAYGQFLNQRLLDSAKYGPVNLHGSILPAMRGAAPIQRAIWQGLTETGVSLMWMVKAMDAGDVIAVGKSEISQDDDSGTLTEKLSHIAADLIVEWLPKIAAGNAPRTPQEERMVTFSPSIKKEERAIDWTKSAEEIALQVRALMPVPVAVTNFRDFPVKILRTRQISGNISSNAVANGQIIINDEKDGMIVLTGNGKLQIIELQPAGKKPMSGADFVRGYHPTSDDKFTS